MTTEMLLSRNKICDAGYYCLQGATVPYPIDTTLPLAIIGNKCEAGHFCPGLTAREECAAGTYESRTGSDACQDCPEGYYCCGSGATTCAGATAPTECEKGYCPAKSSVVLACPAGYYGSAELKKMGSSTDCVHCPEGKFCTTGIIDGNCDAGYFCDFGAIASNDPAKACPLGHFCPAGVALPIRCDEGFYTLATGSPTV